jgi:non-specific serine/threonine protein kinase
MPLDQAVAYARTPHEVVAATRLTEPRPAQTLGQLTLRQREVAALIAQGRSNRQIGEALVITERTVAAHIEHILNKLDFVSRTQIGVWVAEHGLTGSSIA